MRGKHHWVQKSTYTVIILDFFHIFITMGIENASFVALMYFLCASLASGIKGLCSLTCKFLLAL